MWIISHSWYLCRKKPILSFKCTYTVYITDIYISIYTLLAFSERKLIQLHPSLVKWVTSDCSCKTSRLSGNKTHTIFSKANEGSNLTIAFNSNSVVFASKYFLLLTGSSQGWHIRRSCLEENIFNSDLLEAWLWAVQCPWNWLFKIPDGLTHPFHFWRLKKKKAHLTIYCRQISEARL